MSDTGIIFNVSEVEHVDGNDDDSVTIDNFVDEAGNFHSEKAAMFIIRQNIELDKKITLLTNELEARKSEAVTENVENFVNFPSTGMQGGASSSKAIEDTIFATYAEGGIEKEVRLPQSVQFILRSTVIRQSMVSTILRHYHDIPFLRECTVSGSSRKRSGSGRIKALPTQTKLAIIAVVQKLSPSPLVSKLRNETDRNKVLATAEYQQAVKEDEKMIVSLIKKCLSYFLHRYDDEGNLVGKEQKETAANEEEAL